MLLVVSFAGRKSASVAKCVVIVIKFCGFVGVSFFSSSLDYVPFSMGGGGGGALVMKERRKEVGGGME